MCMQKTDTLEDALARTIRETDKRMHGRESFIIAVDGRCAAGKTSFCTVLSERLSGTLIHMDGFFLRKEQRTEERMQEPGGNIDHERFREEVICPLKEGRAFTYRPFDCHTQSFKDAVRIVPGKVTIIEGAYACHPLWWESCDLHIFLDVDEEQQMQRILARNGEKEAKCFQKMWIPLEEKYFSTYQIKPRCELGFKILF